MIIIQLLLAAIAAILLVGIGLLYWMIDGRLTQQQRRLSAFHEEVRRLFGECEEGEAMQILRDLRASRQPDPMPPAEFYSTLSDETRAERDWKRAFESGR